MPVLLFLFFPQDKLLLVVIARSICDEAISITRDFKRLLRDAFGFARNDSEVNYLAKYHSNLTDDYR